MNPKMHQLINILRSSMADYGYRFIALVLFRAIIAILDTALVLSLGVFATLIEESTTESFSPLLATIISPVEAQIGRTLTLGLLVLSVTVARGGFYLLSVRVEALLFFKTYAKKKLESFIDLPSNHGKTVLGYSVEHLAYSTRQSIRAKYLELPLALLDLVANIMLTTFLALIIFLSNPQGVLILLTLVASVFVIQQRLIGKKIAILAGRYADLEIEGNVESYTGIRGFREYSISKPAWSLLSARYEKKLGEQVRPSVDLSVVRAIPAVSYQLVAILVIVLVVGASSFGFIDPVSIGGLTILVAGLLRIASAAAPIDSALNAIRNSLASVKELPPAAVSLPIISEETMVVLDNPLISLGQQTNLLVHATGTFAGPQLLAIYGQSGQGKTTTLEAIAGLREVRSGLLRVEVSRRSTGSPGIAFVSADPEVIHGSFADMVCLQHSQREPCTEALGLLEKTGLLNEFSADVGLERDTLSKGQAARISLVRALHEDPAILLLDEPLANLDEENKDLVIDLIKEEKTRRLIVIASHDLHSLEGEGTQFLKISATRDGQL